MGRWIIVDVLGQEVIWLISLIIGTRAEEGRKAFSEWAGQGYRPELR